MPTDKNHNASTCGLCRSDHPMMTYGCAGETLNLSPDSVRLNSAGTDHLRHFKQGRRVHLSRAQVLEHRRIGLKNGVCKGECERVFEEKGRSEVYESDC